jgi:trans-2,3-dihydro-3-hydroxyanthranilate isomerase
MNRIDAEDAEIKSIPYTILDVFAEAPLDGNPLAVFRGAGSLSTELMQRIAREMNLSETTFILSDTPRDGGYDVRIFTPVIEIPFAGHPTLGTAHVIAHQIAQTPPPQVTLNLKVGPIPVSFEPDKRGEILWMRQRAPEFAEKFDVTRVAEALSISLGDVDSAFPVQCVSTGFPFVIAPLRTMAAVKKARIHHERFEHLVRNSSAKAIFLFSRETYDSANQINARMFAPFHGVAEDPATGSANGCLAAYLIEHRYFGKDSIDLRVEQGYEIKRPSILYLRARRTEDSIEVNVGGRVLVSARGELSL